MTRWFRMYGEAMRHPKVARLSDKEFRLWVRLLAVASENDGIIPPVDDLKYVLNMRLDHLLTGVERLISMGLIDCLEHGYAPHNWKRYQYKSDASNERVAKHRAKCNVTVTPPDTDTDTELVRENKINTDFNYLLSDLKSDVTGSGDKIEGGKKPVKTRKSYAEAFEQFWNAYPTDKMMSKSNASKQFAKLSPEDRQAAIAAVAPFKVWLAGQKDYRTLHAERFISQRRFDGFMPDESAPRLVASNFYAKAGSEELEAWDAHLRLTKGKSAPRDREGGWYFPSEWPPNEEKAA